MTKTTCDLAINGILLVDKPQGITSNALLQQVKQLYRAKKAGHTGSLDPLATGMLPIFFGEATKFCQYLLDADKVYQTTGMLGIKTNTGDALGDITHQAASFTVTKPQLAAVIATFIGSITQVPSMFSALKHQGTPLYKLARAGIEIERKARPIQIYEITLLDFNGVKFTIKVSCSKGTYIRNLIEDIGDKLGTYAHVTQLHRLYTAGFADCAMYSLATLINMSQDELHACLLPIEKAVDSLPVVNLNEHTILQLRQGKIVTETNHVGHAVQVRIHNEAGQFIGVGELSLDHLLKVKRLLAY